MPWRFTASDSFFCKRSFSGAAVQKMALSIVKAAAFNILFRLLSSVRACRGQNNGKGFAYRVAVIAR